MDVNKNSLPNASVEQFVSELMRQYKVKLDVEKAEAAKTEKRDEFFYKIRFEEVEDSILYGYESGWLEELEVLNRNQSIDRKTAARIIHQFMRMELKEKDENDTNSALKLQDLYDCRRCVGHVMQVYVKGIIHGHVDHAGNEIFGMGETITIKEAREIIERVMDAKQREISVQDTDKMDDKKMITAEEAFSYLQSDKYALLIDVRTDREFQEKHLKDARNIPLSVILKNPYIVSDRRDQCILLYCEEGYKSEIAANCLFDAGYQKVKSFAWEELLL